nr:DNA-directed DNA polymerase [Tanacetum cinerariifolium]
MTSSSKLSRDQTSNPTSSTNPTLKGRIRRSSKQKLENSNFEENLPPKVPMADNRIMAQLLQAPTEGYEDAFVILEIAATNFKLKHDLINLVQNKQFFGHDKEDPHAHIRYFNKITSTMRVPNVPNSTIKLMLFPFSLERAARILLEKEPPRSIPTWDDLVSKFINQACPHHGFFELHQLDTFYNALNVNDQDSLNSAAGGNFLDKMLADCLKIIKSKSKVHQTQAKAVVAKVNSSSSTPSISFDVAKLKDMVRALLLDKKNQYSAPIPSPTPAPIKAVEPNCVTYGSTHAYQNCPATSGNVYQDNIQDAPMPNLKPSIPYPSRRDNERRRMDECLALADLGVSINLMPLSVWKGLSLPELTPTCMTLELADRSVSKPIGIAKDVSVKTGRALIDVHKGELTLRIRNEAITYNLDQTSTYSANYDQMTANKIDVTNEACEEYSQEVLGFSDVTTSGGPTPSDDPIVSTTFPTLTPFRDSDFLLFKEADAFLGLEDDPDSPELDPSYYDPEGDILLFKAILNSDPSPPLPNHEQSVPSFKNELKACEAKTIKYSIEEPLEVELKDLPPHLEYAFLEGDNKLPVIIAKEFGDEEKSALIKVEKLLDVGLIYPISYSPWVSPVHCVPKKGCFTVVANEENELIPTRLVTGWRVCIDYQKLKEATRKDHFTLPFMDQMLERLAGNEYYCFLDGFSGIEVDKAKIDVIAKLPHPTTVKGVQSFLGHAGFYRRFIKDFSKISRPMTHLLKKDTLFFFSEDYIKAFQTLKKKLTEAPILIAPNWDLPFELMCDASNFAIGVVLGQRHEKFFWPIHYASKTPTDTESNYTTTEKEMLAVVYAFKKFRSYLIMNKCIVHTDHSALKYLFAKKDAKARLLCWVLLLQEFDFDVINTKGAENLVADHLGQVEVSNRGLKRILERTIGQNRASWSDKLDDALWAFRTAYKTPIRCTPYKLMYGKACHLPIELEHKAYWALKQTNFDLSVAGDHRKIQLNELNELRDHAYENSLIYKEKTKRIHDSKIKNRVFNVGDQVLLFNSRLKIFSGKLKTHWSGPFTIAKVFPYGTVELSQANGPNFKVNGHRIKHYFGGDVPQLVVPDL